MDTLPKAIRVGMQVVIALIVIYASLNLVARLAPALGRTAAHLKAKL